MKMCVSSAMALGWREIDDTRKTDEEAGEAGEAEGKDQTHIWLFLFSPASPASPASLTSLAFPYKPRPWLKDRGKRFFPSPIFLPVLFPKLFP
jgi:hypothetical protein